MPATQESRARTRAFARLIGPYVAIVPSIIAVRAPDMGALAAHFFESDLAVWFAGAGLLFGGLVIIAFHQYWSSLAAVIISLFGWILALRGLTLLIAPSLYERASDALNSVPVVQAIFAVIAALGLYLTSAGWLAKPPAPPAERSP
jgi:hypothetical protein